MSVGLPRKERDYVGVVSDTRVWDEFELRPDDVIISTPPKCGTTWMQTIALMLLQQTDRLEDSVWKLSPWIDCKFRPESPELLAAATNRRCIKSHAPLDGIKYSPEATYIAVYRHPVDVHFSLQNHAENMKEDWLDFMYSGDTASNFERFLTYPPTTAGTDDTTLASIVEHYLSFRQWRDLPNVHLFHYSDMKWDLKGQVSRLDSILSTQCKPELLDKITDATTFQTMKNAAANHLRKAEESPFKDELSFFKSGRSGKWKGRLDRAQMNGFENSLSALVEPDDAQWLCWGNDQTSHIDAV